MKTPLFSVFTVSLLILAGCTPPPELPSEEEVLSAYLNQILGEPDLSDEAGFEYVLHGSEAETLATELASRLETAEHDGVASGDGLVSSVIYSEPASEDEASVLEEVSLCFDLPDYPFASKENFCFLFTDPEFTEGQLVDIEVAGKPLQSQIVLDYFGRIGLAKPDERLSATEYAVPGSNAEAYAIQQSQRTQAELDGGDFISTVYEAVWNELDFYICPPDFKDSDYFPEELCFPYSDFSFEDGLLADFNAGGSPLDGRVLVQEGEPLAIGDIGTVEFLSAYESISGSLYITAEVVSTTEELTIDDWDSVYLIGNGRQIELSFFDGPYQLKEDRRAYVNFVFSGAEIGGDLEVNFYDENYNDVLMTIPIK